MWIKINGIPLESSSIKNIGNIERITDDIIINYYNKNNNYRFFYDDYIEETIKFKKICDHIFENNISTGNINNYLKNEDGSDDYSHIIKSNFKMNGDLFIFNLGYEKISYSEGKCNNHIINIYSKVFDTIDEAEESHNKLLSKLNEIEMSLINIEI